MSIEVSNVFRLFGNQKALNDVSFSVGKGEIVALLGPNGAGKSTMMKILTCFLPQTSGKAQVCGFDVVTHPMEVRSRVGYLPEHNPLYFDLYVKEYLEFVAGLHGLGRNAGKRVNEMIQLVGLNPEMGKKIGALSKGFRQRVGLAQAMIHDPEVLVLDEPTSGLDPNQLEEIRNLIIAMGRSKTVLLSTHIMQEVKAVCDRVVIISRGQIVADTPTGQVHLLKNSNQIICVEFDQPLDDPNNLMLPGVIEVVPLGQSSYRIFTQGNTDLRPEVFRFAVESKRVILSLGKEEQSLEDVFRQITV
ncbi:MAG TPA: gliding motility-associated ABC transporter ATP-binding subunit GldA [Bacteroidales bacterium]|nr:gliding motility-associated ABC transporter ATP-binding subunit GldA [Bacteroidales bacterium]